MLFFRKKKPLLSSIFTDGYHDIHNHLLPGVDDGAPDIATSIHLFEKMLEMGITSSVMTPHIMAQVWENTPASLEHHFGQLKTDAFYSKTSVRLAAEYMLDDQFKSHLQNGPLLSIKDHYVLVEMSYQQPPLQLFELLFELQIEGYKPILAHPERYNFYHGRLDDYKKLKKAGCLFQLNLLAVTGYYGFPVAKTAELLLGAGMYDFTGTDIHHERHIEAFSYPIRIKKQELLKPLLSNNMILR
ncbi:MAG: hypothetical protein RL607_536 [Bacteroidota bacterium]|jgi:tyrosine-protein phosphatase YwqE